MTTKSLRRRINEIQKMKVPYVICTGNHLPDQFLPENIIDFFEEEGLPEVVMDKNSSSIADWYHTKSQIGLEKIYAKTLADLTGKKPEDFLRYTGTEYPPSLDNVETHLIYNPKADITHIFLLPSRQLSKRKI